MKNAEFFHIIHSLTFIAPLAKLKPHLDEPPDNPCFLSQPSPHACPQRLFHAEGSIPGKN
jgi:hypothetical protein